MKKGIRSCIAVVFALLFVFGLALAGCTDEQPEVGVWNKRYGLYEPVSQLENIECDLYYILVAQDGTRGWFGGYPVLVDTWRTYKLEERPEGEFFFAFAVERDTQSSNYIKSATCNYSDLGDERFAYFDADRSVDTNGAVVKNTPAYYSTFMVDSCVVDWEVAYGNVEQLYRYWSVRVYVVFVESDTRIALHEYVFTQKYPINSENEAYTGVEVVLSRKLSD